MKDDLDALLGKALSDELGPAEREALDRAFERDPSRAEDFARDARLGALLGIVLEKDGRFERALRERHRAGKEQTPFVEALRRRGRPAGRPVAAWAAAAVVLGLAFWATFQGNDPAPPPSDPPEAPPVSSRTFRDTQGRPLEEPASGRDATISAVHPDRAFGTLGRLEAGGHGLEVLLWWDVTAVPPRSRVQSAAIVLSGATALPQEAVLRLFQVDLPWKEAEVTWRESARNVSWPRPGLLGARDRPASPLGTLAPADGHRAIARLDARGIALVQSWVDDPGRNHGLLLAGAATTDRAWTVGFASREAHDFDRRPALLLTWVPAESRQRRSR